MKIKLLLGICLLVSVVLNAYLFKLNESWENSFFELAGTTAEVEMVFKASGVDTSYENILAISKSQFLGLVKEVKAGDRHMEFGVDERALQVVHGKLLFQDGVYFGIEVPIPNH